MIAQACPTKGRVSIKTCLDRYSGPCHAWSGVQFVPSGSAHDSATQTPGTRASSRRTAGGEGRAARTNTSRSLRCKLQQRKFSWRRAAWQGHPIWGVDLCGVCQGGCSLASHAAGSCERGGWGSRFDHQHEARVFHRIACWNRTTV